MRRAATPCGIPKACWRRQLDLIQFTGRIEGCVELLAEDGQQTCIDVESLENRIAGWVQIVASDGGSPGSAAEIVRDRDAADRFRVRVLELLVGFMMVPGHSLGFL